MRVSTLNVHVYSLPTIIIYICDDINAYVLYNACLYKGIFNQDWGLRDGLLPFLSLHFQED